MSNDKFIWTKGTIVFLDKNKQESKEKSKEKSKAVETKENNSTNRKPNDKTLAGTPKE